MGIDIIVEKYLTSIKARQGHMVDFFVNPSRKEIQEITDPRRGNSWRFIADAKGKNLYAFPMFQLHQYAWDDYISKEINDSRRMYKTETLFGGTIENGKTLNWGVWDDLYKAEYVQKWINNPKMFAFASKWADIEGWIKENDEALRYNIQQGAFQGI